MIPVDSFAGRNVAVFGLGRNGIATARALIAGGASVTAWDESKDARKAAVKNNIPVEDLYEADWRTFDAFVPSPGVPLTHPRPHPLVTKAQAEKLEILGDAELFAREISRIEDPYKRPKFVAVTGTNGKSTTTALIAHALTQCGLKASAGGNLGTPILDLPALKPDRVYVLELSSYQLDLTDTIKPNVAVLLNISHDHLDRHGGIDGYVQSKQRIFANQDGDDLAVVGVDDNYSQKICTRLSSKSGPTVAPISIGKTLGHGAYVIEGILYDGTVRRCSEIVDLRHVETLPGRHNWQNALAAYVAVRRFVSDDKAIAKSFHSFKGLPHRLETVRQINDVRFVNDSKATNAEASSHALATYDRIYWILGGVPKDGGIASLESFFPKIRKAYLIGQAADAFAETLDGKVKHKKCDDLKVAVERAYKDAREDDAGQVVVLLSPACASFDQFRNFEERGEAFRVIAASLKDKSPNSKRKKESAA